MDRVAIIVINYKNYADTLECLASVFNLDSREFYVVVIDNSPDEVSWAHFKTWAPPDGAAGFYAFDGADFHHVHGKKEDAKIVFIRSDSNRGFAGGNNLGAAFLNHCGGAAYFWFLNNDTIIEPDALSRMLKTFSREPAIGAVGSKILFYDKRDTIQYLGGGDIGIDCGRYIKGGQKDFASPDFEIKGYICGCSFMVSAQATAKAGLWNEDYFMYVEDVEYSARLRKAGYKLYCSAGARIYHKDGKSFNREKIQRTFLGATYSRYAFKNFAVFTYYDIRNWVIFNKTRPGLFRFCYFCFYLPYFLARAFWYIFLVDDRKIARAKVILSAVMDGLRERKGKGQALQEEY